MDCYMQSQLATGSPPKAVDPGKTPWAVIPPAFNAFLSKPILPNAREDEQQDVAMLDDSAEAE